MCYAFEFLAKDPLTADRIASVFAKLDEVAAKGWACWAFSNHDVDRHASRWSLSDEAIRAYTTLLVCLRGSVCLYQGEELGLQQGSVAFEELQDPYGIEFWPEYQGRDGCRTPMAWQNDNRNGGFSDAERSWLPVAPEHLGLSVAAQEEDPYAVLHHYRRAIALRKEHPTFAKGRQTDLKAEGNVLTFERRDDVSRYFVAANLSDSPALVSLPEGQWEEFAGALDTSGSAEGGHVSLEPWQICLRRERE